MCWAVPGKIIEIEGNDATIFLSGVNKRVRLDLIDESKLEDYVLVHAGYAIQKVDPDKARFTIDFFEGGKRDPK